MLGMPNKRNKQSNKTQKISWKLILKAIRKNALDISMVVFVFTIGTYIFYPAIVNADTVDASAPNAKTLSLMVSAMQNETKDFGSLPISMNATARRTFRIPITAYTSDVAQTDETPCITASGLNLCKRNTEDIVAANFLPIGTRVRIPDLYGDRVFYVQDRMNARYDQHLDIWMKDYGDAKQFGLKMAKIEVF